MEDLVAMKDCPELGEYVKLGPYNESVKPSAEKNQCADSNAQTIKLAELFQCFKSTGTSFYHNTVLQDFGR